MPTLRCWCGVRWHGVLAGAVDLPLEGGGPFCLPTTQCLLHRERAQGEGERAQLTWKTRPRRPVPAGKPAHWPSPPPTGLWVQGHPLGSGGRAEVRGRGDSHTRWYLKLLPETHG